MTFCEIVMNTIPVFVGFIVGTFFGMALLGMISADDYKKSNNKTEKEFIQENLADLDFLSWCFENRPEEMQELVRCYNKSDDNTIGGGKNE